MDHDFVVRHNIKLHKLLSPVSIGVIDGRPIISGNITEESEPIRVVLGDLASVISFNIISSSEHSLVLSLPWFELLNPNIDWRKRTIEESSKVLTKDKGFHKISTISVHKLYEEGGRECCVRWSGGNKH
jgi:hypothetical protein